MSRFRIGGSVAAVVLVGILFAGIARSNAPTKWATLAISDDRQTADDAIEHLRAMGPEGLEAMFAAHRGVIDRAVSGALCSRSDTQWQRVRHAIDQVGGQRDCYASRLYWYTDLETAKQAAADTGRPILSLRLLGKLTDEYSCANSRFFRTVLYANHEVADVLRERFVLHWQSERPVPCVTIDFGDGRVLKRTLTGNSIHYVLDRQGRPVDALPGLYGPKAFLRGLEQAESMAIASSSLDADQWQQRVRGYHAGRLAQLTNNWRGDLNELGITVDDSPNDKGGESSTGPADNAGDQPVPARAAALRAIGKSLVEVPILDQLAAFDYTARSERLAAATDDQAWQRLAEMHADDARLDAGSIALVRRQNPHFAKGTIHQIAAEPLTPMIHNFQRAVALDTVRNEYLLHREVHQRYIDDLATADMEELNRWVYAELFLTPASDPWLGLAPEDTYTALENTTVAR